MRGLTALSPLKLRALVSAKNYKEDRQFESPWLQQRGTANRRSAGASSLTDKRGLISGGWLQLVLDGRFMEARGLRIGRGRKHRLAK